METLRSKIYANLINKIKIITITITIKKRIFFKSRPVLQCF